MYCLLLFELWFRVSFHYSSSRTHNFILFRWCGVMVINFSFVKTHLVYHQLSSTFSLSSLVVISNTRYDLFQKTQNFRLVSKPSQFIHLLGCTSLILVTKPDSQSRRTFTDKLLGLLLKIVFIPSPSHSRSPLDFAPCIEI